MQRGGVSANIGLHRQLAGPADTDVIGRHTRLSEDRIRGREVCQDRGHEVGEVPNSGLCWFFVFATSLQYSLLPLWHLRRFHATWVADKLKFAGRFASARQTSAYRQSKLHDVKST